MTLISLLLSILPFVSTLPPPITLPFEQKIVGDNKYGNETLEKIDGIGLVRLDGTTVSSTLDVHGSLISNNASVGSIHVTGEANLRDTTVLSESHFTGYIQAAMTTFSKSITLVSQKAVFTASRLQGVTFKRDATYKGKQFLELKQGTIVDGPVTFESGKGEIHLYSGSKILGPVEGAKVVRKN